MIVPDLAPPQKDLAPDTNGKTNGNGATNQNGLSPTQITVAKIPAVILLGVLAYFALKK
jgi:hypothetical protein